MQIHTMRVQQLQVHNQIVSDKHSLGDVWQQQGCADNRGIAAAKRIFSRLALAAA